MSKPEFTRRLLLQAAAGSLVAPTLANSREATVNKRPTNLDSAILWYDKPATAWTEALPVGNGHLGGMHFGGVGEEHIQLNESTLWAGGPHDYDHPGALAALPEIRKLIFEGRYHDAQVIADREVMSQPLGQAPYQTVGGVFVKFDHEEGEDYRRELDLDRATSSVTYRSGGIKYTRELIASHPD